MNQLIELMNEIKWMKVKMFIFLFLWVKLMKWQQNDVVNHWYHHQHHFIDEQH